MRKVSELEHIDQLFDNLDGKMRCQLLCNINRLLNGAFNLKLTIEDNLMLLTGETTNLSPCIIDDCPNKKYFIIAYYQENGQFLLKTKETVITHNGQIVKELNVENKYFMVEQRLCLENAITISNTSSNGSLSHQHHNHYFYDEVKQDWTKFYTGSIDNDGQEEGIFVEDMLELEKGAR